uniref:Reverse transcriptase domain-containing protein n=1 Tax=Haemonchus contortus TaxID=6289 RepID=A0A7I5EB71_HAECO
MDGQENHVEYTLLNRTYQLRGKKAQSGGNAAFSVIRSASCDLNDALRQSAGKDGISVELLQACGPPLYRALARRYIRHLAECTVPTAWKQSLTVLLSKKGDKEDLANYRPITLLPVLYKVFTRCILARIRRTVDEAQPVERAGFRRNFSCLRLIEASPEHRLPS